MFGKKKGDAEAVPAYKVTYKGGLAALPKAKVGEIRLHLEDDCFRFVPTTGSKKFWDELTIPYNEVQDVEVVDRTVSTAEGLLGGLDSRQLNQKNVLLFSYGDGRVLRTEMLSGVTVMGQAKKAVEFLDLLTSMGVRARFAPTPAVTSAATTSGVSGELAGLASLHESGALTDGEFAAAKARLLG